MEYMTHKLKRSDEKINIMELIYRKRIIGYIVNIQLYQQPPRLFTNNTFCKPLQFSDVEIGVLLLPGKYKTLKRRKGKVTQLTFSSKGTTLSIGKGIEIKTVKEGVMDPLIYEYSRKLYKKRLLPNFGEYRIISGGIKK